MQILDSGTKRDFPTGAVRDNADGKGRMDLVPLNVVAVLLDSVILKNINEYVRNGDLGKLYEAIKLFIDSEYSDAESAVLDISKHYEAGCEKYGHRNWENGMPLHCYIDSGCRHLLKHLRGDKDENHGLAFMWNLMCSIWTHENHPELIDLPFVEKQQYASGGIITHDELARTGGLFGTAFTTLTKTGDAQ